MRANKLIFIPIAFALTLCGLFAIQTQEAENKSAKAQELLKQARNALGGDSALNALQSLTATGEFRGEMQASNGTGYIKLDFLLPDKFMKTVKIHSKEMPDITRIEVVNGDRVWMDVERQQDRSMMQDGPLGAGGMGMPPMGGGGMGRGGRGSSGGRSGGDGETIPGMGGEMNGLDFQKELRAEYASLLTGLLLSSPSLSSAKFDPSGNLNDNNSDALKIDGGEGLILNLFLNQNTHRPAMISYIGSLPRGPANSLSRNRDATEDRRTDNPDSRTGRVEVYFFDFKSMAAKGVGEIWLPYRITKSVDGRTTEELRIKKYTLNPDLKPKQFEKKGNKPDN